MRTRMWIPVAFVCVMLSLTGCSAGSASAPNTTNASNQPTNTSTSTSNSSVPLSGIPTTAAGTLNPMNGSQVHGNAEVKLNLDTKEMTVTLTVSGLKSGAKYTGVITIGQIGGTVYTLSSGTADSGGNLSMTTVVKDVNGIPGNWYASVVPSGASEVASTAVASGALMPG